MRVAVLAYLLHAGEDYRAAGVSTYARHLAEALPAASVKGDIEVFHGADAPVLRGVTTHAVPFPTTNPVVRVAWEQVGFPAVAARRGFDVVHGTVNVVPLVGAGARVVTVHDLSFVRHPERFRRSRVAYLSAAVRRSAESAHRVICVSQSTRADVLDLFRVAPERATVIPPGVPATFRPIDPEELHGFLERQFGGRPFVLHVGTLEPRKNIDILIRAFARLQRRRSLPHVLALVGARGWMYDSLMDLARHEAAPGSIQFVDYVAPGDLPLWYNSAAVLAYPSAYEGFGLPVVEAMACGTPVITSGASSLAEVAAGAAVLVEPGSVEELELALEHVLDDAELRADLSRSGLERAKAYRWDRTAAATWQVYGEAMEERT